VASSASPLFFGSVAASNGHFVKGIQYLRVALRLRLAQYRRRTRAQVLARTPAPPTPPRCEESMSNKAFQKAFSVASSARLHPIHTASTHPTDAVAQSHCTHVLSARDSVRHRPSHHARAGMPVPSVVTRTLIMALAPVARTSLEQVAHADQVRKSLNASE